jgi:hypothetical protein
VITLNVVAFLAMLTVALVVGAVLAVHIYGCNTEMDDRARRFRPDEAINDEAENGWTL